MGAARLSLGDEITIGDIHEGFDRSSPLQKWRVGETVVEQGKERIRLIPLNQDSSVDAFNAAAGEFWIEGPVNGTRIAPREAEDRREVVG